MMGRGGFALLLILHIAEGDGGDFLMGQGSKVGIRSDAASDLLARAAQENAQGGGVKYGPECQVCGGACGSETTRCPRCCSGRPPVHSLCEEEWLLQKKVCMFCRLAVRRPVLAGAAAKDTVWSYRTRANKEYSVHLNRAATRQGCSEVWNKFSGGTGPKRLDEVSITCTLQKAVPFFKRGERLPAWVNSVASRMPEVVRMMEGRVIPHALEALARLSPEPKSGAGPFGMAARSVADHASNPAILATLTGPMLCGAAASCVDLGLGMGGRGGAFVEGLFRRMGEEGALLGACGGDMAGAVRAMAKLGARNATALSRLAEELGQQKTLHSLSAAEVCTVLEGLHEMHEKAGYFLVRLSARLMDKGLLPRLRAEHVGCIAAAFAGLGQRDVALFEAMAGHLQSGVACTSRANAEAIMRAYARFGLGSVELARSLAPSLASGTPSPEEDEEGEEEGGGGGGGEGGEGMEDWEGGRGGDSVPVAGEGGEADR